MKRLFFISILACTAFVINNTEASAWGRQGHSTIAYVAETHLTPKAKATLLEYLDGLTLSAIASDADLYRAQWTMDLGFVPTNPEASRVSFLTSFDFTSPLNISPYSHSITVDENFECYPTDNLDGAYINNAAYYVDQLAAKLKKEAPQMDKYERYKAIALIVHLVGDMHCPMHIVYIPKNMTKGKAEVTFKGQKTTLHSIWDGKIFSAFYNWSFSDLAHMVDTASKKEFREITEGDIYDYASDSARNSWPAVCAYGEGAVIPSTYVVDMRPVMFSQLRNSGYRLAAIFNDIF